MKNKKRPAVEIIEEIQAKCTCDKIKQVIDEKCPLHSPMAVAVQKMMDLTWKMSESLSLMAGRMFETRDEYKARKELEGSLKKIEKIGSYSRSSDFFEWTEKICRLFGVDHVKSIDLHIGTDCPVSVDICHLVRANEAPEFVHLLGELEIRRKESPEEE